MGKYIRLKTASPEPDAKTGSEGVYVFMTNIAIKEIKSAEKQYITFKKDNKPADEMDGNDLKEMKISEQIWDDIHEVWKVLNSGTSHNYGSGPMPDPDHLKTSR